MAGGLPGALPGRAWALVLACVAVAAASLLVPPSLVTALGVPFVVFFAAVTGLQGAAALGIVAVVWHYRGFENEERAAGSNEESEWRFGP